jgi:hypothetical protein
MTTCAACSGEAKALDGLAEGLRTAQVETLDELHVARERTRLLAAFDRSLLTAGGGSRGRWLVPLTVAIAVVSGVFLFSRSRPIAPLALPSIAGIHAEPDAVWSKEVEAGTERVVLVHGVLAIHVDHDAANRQRLMVILPDGELEDIGTTFTVSAANGHTERVVVQEGSVLLRLRGRSPVALSAGESWPLRPPTTAASTPIVTPPPPDDRPARPGPSRKERVVVLPTTGSSAPAGPDASEDFRAVVRLLDAGEDCRAAAGFLQFASHHPSDSRAEDAAYLRVIALHRCGSNDEMKEAARAYLNVYPKGFRRAEVERLSQ